MLLSGCLVYMGGFTAQGAIGEERDNKQKEEVPVLLTEAVDEQKPLEIRVESCVNNEGRIEGDSHVLLYEKEKNGVQNFADKDPFTLKVYADMEPKDQHRVEVEIWTEQKQENGNSLLPAPASKNPVHKTSFEMKPVKEEAGYMTEIPYYASGVYNSENGTIHYQVYVWNDQGQKILYSEPMSVQAYGGYLDGKYEGFTIEKQLKDRSIRGGNLDVYGSCAISSRLQITDYIYIHGDSTLWLETQDYEPALYLKGNTKIRGDGWESKIILSRKLKMRPEVGAIAVESGTADISDISFFNEDDYIEGISKESHGIWGGGHTTLNIRNCKLSSPSTGTIVGTYGNLHVRDSIFDKGIQGVHFNGAYDNQVVRITNCKYRNLAQGIQGGTPNGKKIMSLYLEGVNHFADIDREAIDVSNGEYLSFAMSSSTKMEHVGSGVKVAGFTRAALRNTNMKGRTSQSGVGAQFYNTWGETSAAVIDNFNVGLETRDGSSVQGIDANIQNNSQGVLNHAVYEHTSGNISNNQKEGVNHKGAAFWFTGGSITGNGNCDVYLERGKVIDWKKSGEPNEFITKVLSRSTDLGTTLVRNQFQENGHTAAGEIGEKYFAAAHGGRVIGRGGNRNGREATHFVLSQYYNVNYDKNSSDQIANMPQDEKKYWEEDFIISPNKPVNETYSFIKFMGWDLDKDSQSDIDPGGILKINKDMQLRAVWKDKVFIEYHSNEEGKKVKTELITSESLKSNKGIYRIQKNTGYTNYSREGYTYAGFDLKQDTFPLHVSYKEDRENHINFSDLLQYVQEVNGESRLLLYAIWDKKPEIIFTGVQEFYEGTEVNRQDLKEYVRVEDAEEGDITERLRVVEIQYAEGKLIDGKPTKGTTVKFSGDMGEQDRLDTWFMALDKDKSPVTHHVVYEATDSTGGVSGGQSNVYIHYNQFPVIEASDRYFTIEEAQRGDITEESLLKEGLNTKKIQVSDKEEDVRDSEYMKTRIHLEKFVPEEFTGIKTDTMILLELVAKDSMGPGKEGKETTQTLKVYVKQSGEIPQKPDNSRVRFFDEKNYRKNEGKKDAGRTVEEKEAYNHNGGFHTDSVWYTIPQYKEVINRCFDPQAQPMAVYSFPYDKCLEVKKFIENNGIGNAREESALSRFTEQFMYK